MFGFFQSQFSVVSKRHVRRCDITFKRRLLRSDGWPALLGWDNDTVFVARDEMGFGGMTEIKYWGNEERWGPDTV